jgi:hypothetical protein
MIMEQNSIDIFNENPVLAALIVFFARRYPARAAVNEAPRRSERMPIQRLRLYDDLDILVK